MALPLLALLVSPLPEGREFLRELSVGFGFTGASILCIQFALTARFKRVQAPYGIDLVYHFHRLFNVISAPWRARLAVLATLGLLAIIVTSAW